MTSSPPSGEGPLNDRMVAFVAERTAREALAWWRSQDPDRLETTAWGDIIRELRPHFETLEKALTMYELRPSDSTFRDMWEATMTAMQEADRSQKEAARASIAASRRSRGGPERSN